MGNQIVLPTTEALLDAMGIAKASSEAAEYLRDQFVEKINSAGKNDTAASLIEQIEMFADQVAMQLNPNEESWSGKVETAYTTFNKLHDEIAAAAAETLGTSEDEHANEEEHRLNFAIDEDGNFVRGWS